MEQFIRTVTEWPAIIQGAIGSGLFVFTFYIIQKLLNITSGFKSNISNKVKKEDLQVEIYKYSALANKERRAEFIIVIFYRACRPFTNGLLWLTYGLLTSSFVPIFGIVGYVGALFYFSILVRLFRPIPIDIDPNERIDELVKELKEIKNA